MQFVKALLSGLANMANTLFVRTKLLPEDPVAQYDLDPSLPTVYITRLNSYSDKAALRASCKKLGLPDPDKPITIGDKTLPRVISLQNPEPLFGKDVKATDAQSWGETLIEEMRKQPDNTVQVLPATILWGRNPGKEKPGLGTIVSHSVAPSWLRKIFVVLLSGRDNLIRFSQPIDLQTLLNDKSDTDELAHKLIRVARVHFKRQKLAATGPKLPTRDDLFQGILASTAIKKAIADEAKSKGLSQDEARAEAIRLLDEIAADYHESMVRVGDRILTWLWNKLYNGIDVKYAEEIHELTRKGHEIIYVPCHRSHMDYMLLTYVIYHQGLVPPHIAAGINLNFWPAGGIFRRSGAFFIRRSFQGNKLYSAVFREYLCQLFAKGYSVKYYTEGGRSRTGRLLPPKTGMLAMTMQSMLRGIDRPISIVPVYIGYEHVMEINTYLKELAGNSKKNESVLGIFKAIKNLRNYGRGYVNFAKPINLNQFLTEQQPDWRDHINADGSSKPQWLGQHVATLANQVMTNINQAAALNAINLMAMILLVNDKFALSRHKLEAQLSFYLRMQRHAGYSDTTTQPEEDARALVDHALTLEKFDIIKDQFGEIITIKEKERTLFTYYRNNVIHLFAVPSLIATHVLQQGKTTVAQVTELVKEIYPLFACEWFMADMPSDYVSRILAQMAEEGLIILDGEHISRVTQPVQFGQLEMLSRIGELTLQRYAIVAGLIKRSQVISRAQLEKDSHTLATRMGTLHGIKSPEFFDKKVLTSLINGMRDAGLLESDEQNNLLPTEALESLYQHLVALLPIQVMDSINETINGH